MSGTLKLKLEMMVASPGSALDSCAAVPQPRLLTQRFVPDARCLSAFPSELVGYNSGIYFARPRVIDPSSSRTKRRTHCWGAQASSFAEIGGAQSGLPAPPGVAPA